MITSRLKRERPVIKGVGQPLDRTVEIGRGRVSEKEMLETFRDEAPAPDERVAQDQVGVVPDKTISQGRGVDRQNERDQKKRSEIFFHGADCVGQNQ